jgi:ubiquitin carboxyl-terminal hydrolase 1
MSLLKGDADRPAGLVNRGVVCFQNSILQGLASLRHYGEYLDSLRTEDASIQPQRVVALRKLIHDLNDPANNGRTFKTERILEQESMSTWQQQDAQEYFSKLLDEVDKEIGKLAQTARKPAGFEVDLCSTKDDTTASQHSDDSGYQSASGQPKAGSAGWKSLRNPLDGRHAQRVACLTCGYSEGLTMIPFNCLTLNLGTGRQDTDLYQLLDGYTALEHIPGVECPKCTLLRYQGTLTALIDHMRAQGKPDETIDVWSGKLEAVNEALEEQTVDDETIKRLNITKKFSSTKTKQIVLARPPQSLVVHMNRSVFNERTGEMLKNRAAVRFPSDLDLGPWCLGSRIPPEAAEAAEDEEDWLLDPRLSMIAGSQGRPRMEGPIYELCGVVTHHGAHNNGHYVCYRKHGRVKRDSDLEQAEKPAQLSADVDMAPMDDSVMTTDCKQSNQQVEPDDEPQWWELSDDDVTKVDEKFVFSLSDVFMLFYDCVDPRQVPIADTEKYEDSVSLQAPKLPHSPQMSTSANIIGIDEEKRPALSPTSEADDDI